MTRMHWLSLLLLISIGINVFAVGILVSPHVQRRVGFLARDHSKHSDRNAAPDRGARGGPKGLGPGTREPLLALRGVVRVMGGRKDARVRAVWDEGRAQMQDRHQRLATAQAELDHALISLPYTESAVHAALDRVRTESQGIQELSGRSLLQLMRQLTPEERVKLTRLMEKQKDTPPKLR